MTEAKKQRMREAEKKPSLADQAHDHAEEKRREA